MGLRPPHGTLRKRERQCRASGHVRPDALVAVCDFTEIMISVAQAIEYCKDGIYVFTGTEVVPCPVCGGRLRVRNTCHRKLRREEECRIYRLRVMICTTCGKTHRELPQWMIPYKRMDAALYCKIAQTPRERHLEVADTNTWTRVQKWIWWFLLELQAVRQAKISSHDWVEKTVEDLSCQEWMGEIRRLVNSGKWVQHRYERRRQPCFDYTLGISKERGCFYGCQGPKKGVCSGGETHDDDCTAAGARPG